MADHPLEFDSYDNFRATRDEWHASFNSLITSSRKDFKVMIRDEAYDGYCTHKAPVVIFSVDVFVLLVLVLTAGYFVYQDLTTPFGASSKEIFIVCNCLFAVFTLLGVFTYPTFYLLRSAVRLSDMLRDCTMQLKAAQRSVVSMNLDLDRYNLHAQLWDGTVLGVREPIFNYIVDREFEEWFFNRLVVLLVLCCAIIMYLVYHTNVKSLVQWRSAIPSVVCIGVIFPKSDPNKLWRVGSGFVVSSSKGLILTNWHLFQRMGMDKDVSDYPQVRRQDSDAWSVDSRTIDSPFLAPLASPFRTGTSEDEALYLKETQKLDSMKKSLQYLRSNEDEITEGIDLSEKFDEYDIPMEPPLHANSAPNVLHAFETESLPSGGHLHHQHRHLTNQNRYAESLVDVFPEMKIYIGTASRKHPHWQYEAWFTGVESPSAEFTPFGLDLMVLKITGKANFVGLQTEEDPGSENISFTYKFESVTSEPINFEKESDLVKCQFGNPLKLSAGIDKLRLLGYPASGGFTLSVLTSYYTGISYDYPMKHRGAWLNVNVALPHGGSGGAAVNSEGEIVGVCTQTKGELTNIRSISEAKHLIERAKKAIEDSKEKHRESSDKKSRYLRSFKCKEEKIRHLESVVNGLF